LENIYLTDVYIYDNDHCTVTDVYICISGRQGIISVKWTPGEPFLIRKGEYAYIFAYYSDPHVSHGHYSGNPVRVMEFECENGTYCTYTAFLLNSDMRSNSSQHEIYLWQFKGLDLESYYLNYEERMREFLWNKYKNR